MATIKSLSESSQDDNRQPAVDNDSPNRAEQSTQEPENQLSISQLAVNPRQTLRGTTRAHRHHRRSNRSTRGSRSAEGDVENGLVELPEPDSHSFAMSDDQVSQHAIDGDKSLIDDSTIHVNIDALTPEKRRQIITLKRRLKNNKLYALYYWDRARFWSWIYWIIGLTSPILLGLSGIANAVFDICKNEQTANFNIVINTVISSVIFCYTFVDPSGRHKNYNDGGNEYNDLYNEIYTTVFTRNEALQSIDFEHVLERYNDKLSFLTQKYPEPKKNILQTYKKDYNLPIKLVTSM